MILFFFYQNSLMPIAMNVRTGLYYLPENGPGFFKELSLLLNWWVYISKVAKDSRAFIPCSSLCRSFDFTLRKTTVLFGAWTTIPICSPSKAFISSVSLLASGLVEHGRDLVRLLSVRQGPGWRTILHFKAVRLMVLFVFPLAACYLTMQANNM